MPLIQHSAEFLAKQNARKIKERAKTELEEKAIKVQEFLKEQEILSEIEKLRSRGIENLSPAEKQQLKDWYLAATINNVPMIKLFPIRYMETLRQIVRKLRLHKNLSQTIIKKDISDPEFFKETAEIMEILSHNIEHLQSFDELGVEQYKEKYNLLKRKNKLKNGSEIRPLAQAISEFQESPDEFANRTREYIRSLNLRTSRTEESE